jgi:hypothetical protein
MTITATLERIFSSLVPLLHSRVKPAAWGAEARM